MRVAETPEERARALLDQACFASDHEGDDGSARMLLENAADESPDDASLWLALELSAGKTSDGELRDRALAAGLPRERVWFDPGIGFGKNARQSFELLRRLAELRDLGVPLVVGASRKSFIKAVDDAGPEERLGGTIAACLWCAAQGADVLRVHDVRAVRQALSVTEMLTPARAPEAAHA